MYWTLFLIQILSLQSFPPVYVHVILCSWKGSYLNSSKWINLSHFFNKTTKFVLFPYEQVSAVSILNWWEVLVQAHDSGSFWTENLLFLYQVTLLNPSIHQLINQSINQSENINKHNLVKFASFRNLMLLNQKESKSIEMQILYRFATFFILYHFTLSYTMVLSIITCLWG